MSTIRPPFEVKPRGAHSACAIGSKLYIFGGLSPHNPSSGKMDDYEYLNTVLVFDFNTAKWSIPQLKGTVPQPCAGHAAAVAGTNMFVFGGRNGSLLLQDMYMLDTS